MRRNGVFAIMRNIRKLIAFRHLLSVGIISVSIWGQSQFCCAEKMAERRDLSLIHYEKGTMLPAWETDFATYEALNVPIFTVRVNRLSRQTNLELNNTLSWFSKKVCLSFSPQVVMKPFVAVREVQDILAFYQTRQQSRQIEIDQNFEAKTAKLMLGQQASIENSTRSRFFALSPYQNRIYGLHLQINFK